MIDIKFKVHLKHPSAFGQCIYNLMNYFRDLQISGEFETTVSKIKQRLEKYKNKLLHAPKTDDKNGHYLKVL